MTHLRKNQIKQAVEEIFFKQSKGLKYEMYLFNRLQPSFFIQLFLITLFVTNRNYQPMIKRNTSHPSKFQIHFTSQQLTQINASIAKRHKIQDALNKFTYKDKLNYPDNVQHLSQTISPALQLEPTLKKKFLTSFSDYISIQENVPIQVNFKKIRYEQLCNLLSQWETSIRQLSIIRPSQRLYSIQHRNIIFSRVFAEQKQVIEEYFEELSDKKMLKGVDLYQLLADILSHYFLYQYLTDNQTFFEKVNSFNNFLEVVHKFINSETRIIIDNKSKDFQYIKLYQFQALIYYWESINPQLEIRSDRRFSSFSKEVQTQFHQICSIAQFATQTYDCRDKPTSLEQVINQNLKSLNKLTELQSDPEKLQIIQNLVESLRKQKIKLAQYEKSKNARKKSETSRNILHINSIDSRFLDVTSQQSDVELQKTQRILKGYASPDQLRESASKRKSQNQISLDKTVEVNDKVLMKIKVPEVQNKKKSPQKIKLVQFHSFSSENNDLLGSCSSETKPIKILPEIQSQKQRIINKKVEKAQKVEALNEQMRVQTESSEKSSQKSGYFEGLQEKQPQKISMLSLFERIYNHYADPSSKTMDANKLHSFFVEIGIITQRESIFQLKCLRLNPIKNLHSIKQIQFLQIMGLVMKDDKDLTYDVIAQFVDLYVKRPESQKRVRLYEENQKYLQSKNVDAFHKETYGASEIRVNMAARMENAWETPKEPYPIKTDKQFDRLYPKYPAEQTVSRLQDPYKRTAYGNSFQREKSKDTSSRKKRYMYCQESIINPDTESYLNKLNPLGTNKNPYR